MFELPRTKSASPAGRRGLRVCGLEKLEPREMLSAAGLAAIQAHPTAVRTADDSAVAGFSPAQVAHAYGFDQLGKVAGKAANGAGQTIAIVDAFDDATIASDLQTFDSRFGLPAPPSFKKVDQQGGGKLPSASPPGDDWTVEESLDVEWAHAMAPGANILLVEANSDDLNDLLTAVSYAGSASGVSVVSISWGSSEFAQETQLDGYFTTPAGHGNVSFVAAAGDNGTPGLWPAYSPNVVAVGGTSLQTSASGSYRSEIAWSFGGGGPSQFEREPGCQAGVQSSGARTIPDVAYNADPNSGFAIYDTLDPYVTGGGWDVIGGTSAGTPQWAALLAIANQQRAASHLPALRAAVADLYQLPMADFHDVTTGTNGFSAGPGYDLVTGRGTPYVNRIVPALASTSVSGVQASALPIQSDLSARTLSKLRATRVALDLIAWDTLEDPSRRGRNSELAAPSPSGRELRMVRPV
jgi:subtilase family serine protease